MSNSTSVSLRDVVPADLDVFFQHQCDPEANWMAAFVGPEPRDRVTFDAHWGKILNAPATTTRTVLSGGQVAGYISCYQNGAEREVTYWLGREHWGRGVATQALGAFLALLGNERLRARAAVDNQASVRVLQKCGFTIIGTDRGFAPRRGVEIDEYLLLREPVRAPA